MFKTKPGKYDLSVLGRQMFLHCQMLHLRNCTDKNQCHWPLSSIVMHFVVVTKQMCLHITSPFFLTIFTEWLILTHCIAPEQMQQYLCSRLCYYNESILGGGMFSTAPPRLILHASCMVLHWALSTLNQLKSWRGHAPVVQHFRHSWCPTSGDRTPVARSVTRSWWGRWRRNIILLVLQTNHRRSFHKFLLGPSPDGNAKQAFTHCKEIWNQDSYAKVISDGWIG